MGEEYFKSINFKRKYERRTSEVYCKENRRKNERRTLGIGWLPLFRNVDESAVEEALVDTEVLTLSTGTSLLRIGETNNSVYILLCGKVSAYLDNVVNPDAGIAISVGECVGELSAIDGMPVSAWVIAITEVRVLKLSRDVFWYRLMLVPGVARNMMVALSERMRRTSEQNLKAQREHLELIHIRKELDVARQLQSSMLPQQHSLFSERIDVEVCGFMEPASDIGGDLFDAFFVDENHLFFCIGDVSGHGIAAALFMARTIGLLHILAMNTDKPDKLLEMLNDQLCVGNETNIFVTMFCGFLDVGNGTLTYSNGGHCAPILSIGREIKQLTIPKGVLIGAFPGMKYSSMEFVFNFGDVLLCYTDGVTEAQNQTGEEFTEDRCLKIVAQSGSNPLKSMLETIRSEVVSFTGSNAFEDDCTMLAIRRKLS